MISSLSQKKLDGAIMSSANMFEQSFAKTTTAADVILPKANLLSQTGNVNMPPQKSTNQA